MKQSLFKWGIAPLVACTLLVPAPIRAQAVRNIKATGLFLEEVVPGIVCISDRGHVSLKGEVHIVRMVSDEPRVAGQMRGVNLDVSLKPDGTGTFSGIGWLEVGIWDLTVPQNPKFTRTDGVWETKYEGIINADGSTEYRITAFGIGGTIDGLRLIVTGTRASSSPADPYLFSGKITAVGRD